MTKSRIGILGGSFNPPHLGHLEMAEMAKNQLNLRQVWLMISPQNPLKSEQDMAPLKHRFAMCEKLAAGKPWLKVTDIETRLGTRYTADTLEELKKEMPEIKFFWLMGDDNLASFHKWHNWQKIAELAPIVVFNRGGGKKALESPVAKALKEHKVPPGSPEETPPNWRILDNDLMPVSATELREHKTEKSAFLTPDVAAYIKDKNLYNHFNASTHK